MFRTGLLALVHSCPYARRVATRANAIAGWQPSVESGADAATRP